jgi:hypothetical protein
MDALTLIAQQAQQAIATANAVAQRLRNLDTTLKARNDELARRYDKLDAILAGRRPTTAELILAGAEKIVAFTYNLDIVLATGSTGRQGGTVLVNQEGYFLLDRVYASYRMTAGGNAGRFRPISSDDPTIAVGAAGVADELDFLWEMSDGTAQRLRQENPTPGAILFRRDQDGKYREPDVFPPGTTINLFVTPLVAPSAANVFTFSLVGRQCLNVLQDGIR